MGEGTIAATMGQRKKLKHTEGSYLSNAVPQAACCVLHQQAERTAKAEPKVSPLFTEYKRFPVACHTDGNRASVSHRWKQGIWRHPTHKQGQSSRFLEGHWEPHTKGRHHPLWYFCLLISLKRSLCVSGC
ncbi:mCG125822, isoform CRA_c [Mus musculus]|nr:mCG125822, isoform CRA_c [Mus musculus]